MSRSNCIIPLPNNFVKREIEKMRSKSQFSYEWLQRTNCRGIVVTVNHSPNEVSCEDKARYRDNRRHILVSYKIKKGQYSAGGGN